MVHDQRATIAQGERNQNRNLDDSAFAFATDQLWQNLEIKKAALSGHSVDLPGRRVDKAPSR